ISVTPPEFIASDKVLVRLKEGPKEGETVLIPREHFTGTHARWGLQQADRFAFHTYTAELVQEVPAGRVAVREWRLSKYAEAPPRVLYVPADTVQPVVAPVVGNYPEAIRALTAGEAAKSLSLSELLSRT